MSPPRLKNPVCTIVSSLERVCADERRRSSESAEEDRSLQRGSVQADYETGGATVRDKSLAVCTLQAQHK